ncbi:RING-type E3 ubiquitin transferase [Plasmodiophora brassicae]|uniref:RING-type E3 ubiquitin transferase n=1 Tax=Plasmodiophora brassicae TaxID=37360 RepID=A0A0G4IHX6_PLABS|nr:hypothetical protein PBRA_000462 [Plasmodiophora brassicae]
MFKLHTSRLAVLPLIVLLSGLGDAITIRISDGLTQYFVPDERARMHSAVLELEMMALPDVTDFFLPSSLGIRDETLGLIVGFMTNVSLTQVEDACQWVRHELGERDVANNALVMAAAKVLFVDLLIVAMGMSLPLRSTGQVPPAVRELIDELLPTESDDRCSICQMAYTRADDIGTLPDACNHRFHQECINHWLSLGKTTCPNCRRSTAFRSPASWWSYKDLLHYIAWEVEDIWHREGLF